MILPVCVCVQIAKEHLLMSAASKRLCFACIRDATAADSAAQIALFLCKCEQEKVFKMK